MKLEQHAKELKHEIDVMSQFNHPNIAKLMGSGRVGNRLFMVVELLDGGSLNQRLGFVPKYKGN